MVSVVATRSCALLLAWGALCLTAPARAQQIVPPSVVERVDAASPPETEKLTAPVTVTLLVLVAADGSVERATVHASAGESFDAAAIAAVTKWRFHAAERDGKPIPSQIHVGITFTPPPPTIPASAPSPSPSSPPVNVPVPVPMPAPAPSSAPTDVEIHGPLLQQDHGSSDFHIDVGALRLVPRTNAADYLKLAPGILLTNEGGEGHAEQVFLRGFDAREGQDLEFSVDGVPLNDTGNPHGNGYADTHFIIPELIQSLRVTEGPFSPYQGNYAVAGSADYHLGLEQRGITTKVTYGSWNTERLLLMWGPPGESSGTFGAVEAYKTDGFGVNRAATRGSAMGQYEIPLSNGATLRIGGQAYATHFETAGVIRADDYESGRIGFYGTEDNLQGGDASRFSIYANYQKTASDSAFAQSLFLIRRDMRLREDFTGFLLDTQDALDTLHDQRGDLIDLSFGAWTMGGRGLGQWSTLLGGLKQAIEVGYLARVDITSGTQYRNTVPGDIPYKIDTDLDSTLTDIGLYADGTLRPWKYLVLKGGVRADTFDFNVLNNCAVQGDFDNPSKTDPPINQSCHDQLPFGAHREPVQRSSTSAVKLMPRATATFGPLKHFNASVSYGQGVRSIDPNYISQDLDTPFASVAAYEGGVTYANTFGPVNVSARSIFFETKVDKDLVFDQTAGRNVLANGTTRVGWVGAVRAAGSFFDENVNLTLVHPTFDDTHLQIPYVPNLVFREDLALFHELPFRISDHATRGALGLGYTFVGKRALPYNQESEVISVLDANVALAWRGYELSLAITNLLNTKYRLGEYNYASDFHSQPEPTLVPARAFTAGAPRGIFLSLSANFGGGA